MPTYNFLFGNQAYKRSDEDKVELEQGLKVLTPLKKQKGQKELSTEEKNIQMQDHTKGNRLKHYLLGSIKLLTLRTHQTFVRHKDYLHIFMEDLQLR